LGWTYIFFRARNLRAVALALMVCLLSVDRVAALVFAPYLVYLVFANWCISFGG
jgi:tryptophan-rich sensory protein